MPDDRPLKGYTHPPPPMDPFPTYQTPYPRSNKVDDQNPFIQFRRFADEQVSTLFAGFPQFFGVSQAAGGKGSEHWKREVEDIMRQRQEWEEGFRKQFEQEMEEMRQQLEKSKTEAWKSMEDAWKQHSTPQAIQAETNTPAPTPWWTRGNAAKCPALNGQEPQKNANKCPAMYDEQGQPKTELDAYDALQINSQTPAQEAPQKQVRSRLPTLGWDGKQMRKSWTDKSEATTQEEQVNPEMSHARPTTYSLWAARRMQPFDNADQTIPWLMLSPYSPIYLCNPAQSRLFKVRVQESEGAPLQISGARFFERWYTDVDEKMATRKPWADAFEDLLSLQQTGRMVTRDNWNTWRTPSTWIHDMASRGSLGNQWGFDDQGLLVKRSGLVHAAAELPATGKEDRCSRWRKNRECRRNKSFEAPSLPEQPAGEESVLVDKVTEALAPFPLFGSIISAADAIVSAVAQAAEKEIQAQTPLAELPGDAPTTIAELPAETTDQTNTSSSTYSNSSSAYAYHSTTSSSANSVVSTLTSTRTRTLPDGSVETKRVLKRRFADGSEQSDENLEIQNGNSAGGADANSRTSASPFVSAASETEDEEIETPTRSAEHWRQPIEETRPQISWPEDAQQKIKLLEEELRRRRDSHPGDNNQKEAVRQPRQLDFSRRAPVDEVEAEPEVQPPQIQSDSRPASQPDQRTDPRRGNGWFWN